MPTIRKKFIKAPFTAQLGAAVTKRFTAGDADSVELVALPVLPASPFRTVPGDVRSNLEMLYDANQLIALQSAKGRRLPLDVDHATEGAATDTRARGWFNSLTTAELEPDAGLEPGVLYAWVELTPLGRQELADKLYGYTSGVAAGFWLDDSRIQLTRVKSLALTNNPATEMPLAFTEESDGDEDAVYTGHAADAAHTDDPQMLKELLEALGLTADATLDAAKAAIAALTAASQASESTLTSLTAQRETDTVALTAAQTQVTALTAQVTELTTQLSAFQAADTDRAVSAAVDAAIVARKATPAQRDSFLELARSNLTAFNAAMAAAPEVLGASQAGVSTPIDNNGLTADQLAFCKQYGIEPSIYARNLRGSQ